MKERFPPKTLIIWGLLIILTPGVMSYFGLDDFGWGYFWMLILTPYYMLNGLLFAVVRKDIAGAFFIVSTLFLVLLLIRLI